MMKLLLIQVNKLLIYKKEKSKIFIAKYIIYLYYIKKGVYDLR